MKQSLRSFLALLITATALCTTAPPAHGETIAAGPILINEVHYAPVPKNERLEYVELFNAGVTPIDLTFWSLEGGIEFDFPPGSTLSPQGYAVVAQDPDVMARVYGVTAYGPFSGRLSNEGESLLLRNAAEQEVDEISYKLGFPWPTVGGDVNRSIGLIQTGVDNDEPGAWRSGHPTPGRRNDGYQDNLPPLIGAVTHTPQQPTSRDNVTVQAQVYDPDGIASVDLLVQPIAPGYYVRITDPIYTTAWQRIPMGGGGDNLYRADIPAALRKHRNLIRYRIEATDTAGHKVTAPYSDDPQPNFALYVYDGVPSWTGAIKAGENGYLGQRITYDFNQMRPLPVYQLIANPSDVQDAQYIPDSPMTKGYMGKEFPWFGTLVYNGVVYDHIGFRARGGLDRYSMGKNNWKFNFTRGHAFQATDDFGQPYPVKWDKLNFSSVFQHAGRWHRGEQGMFESVSYRLFNLAGVPASNTHFVHFRVVDQIEESTSNQYEGDFWGLYLAIENMDGRFLEQHELPDGNLYEMKDWTGELDNLGEQGVTDKSDLIEFMNRYIFTSPDGLWWRENFDLGTYYSFRSILEAVHHYDVDQGKNYDYYLNPETGRWSILPWDLDLTWAKNMFGVGNEPFRTPVLSNIVFMVEYQNRLREIRDLLFNPEQINILLEEQAALIDSPANRYSMIDTDRARWDYDPLLESRYVEPGAGTTGMFYVKPPSHDFPGMLQIMRNWVASQGNYIDSKLLYFQDYPDTPSVAYVGPANYPADRLTFQASSFADPQGNQTFAAMQWRAAEVVWPGLPGYDPLTRNRYEIEANWTSPELTKFESTMTLPQGACGPGRACRVRVRMKDTDGRWSHWSEPIQFVTSTPVNKPTASLRLVEIMYSPTRWGMLPGSDLEFIELKNVGATPIDLSNMRIVEGVEYTFPAGARLDPGQFLVLAGDSEEFRQRYGLAPFASFAKSLSNGGERLKLIDAFGRTVQSAAYDDKNGWPAVADGRGHSLVANTPDATGDAETAAYWRASTAVGGSPGVDDPLPVVINEVVVDPGAGVYTSIELHNPNSQDVDVGGWILTTAPTDARGDRTGLPGGMRIAEGTRIPAKGYVALPVDMQLRLQPAGNALTLVGATPSGILNGYQHTASVEATTAGHPVGRYLTSDGREVFPPFRAQTLGGPNAEPAVGPLIFSRLMVNPKDGEKWVELVNTSAEAVALYEPNQPDQHWWLTGLVFPLPYGVTLPPGGRLWVTDVEPTSLCQSSAVPHGVRVIGPFGLGLASEGATFGLARPVLWVGGATALAMVDAATFKATAPWPPIPSDNGALVRSALDGFGLDPQSWRAEQIDLQQDPGGTDASGIGLCAFDVIVDDAGTSTVRWVTTADVDVVRYRIQRSELDGTRFSSDAIVTEMEAIVGGAGPASYEFVDNTASPGQFYIYRLQAITGDGSVRDSAVTGPRISMHMVHLPVVAQ